MGVAASKSSSLDEEATRNTDNNNRMGVAASKSSSLDEEATRNTDNNNRMGVAASKSSSSDEEATRNTDNNNRMGVAASKSSSSSDEVATRREATRTYSKQEIEEVIPQHIRDNMPSNKVRSEWELWALNYLKLKDFHTEHGNSDVVKRGEKKREYEGLSRWSAQQRRVDRKGKLIPERKAKLEALSFRFHYKYNVKKKISGMIETDPPTQTPTAEVSPPTICTDVSTVSTADYVSIPTAVPTATADVSATAKKRRKITTIVVRRAAGTN
eukprot:CAMPEP_0113456986 /NCGR_PEP_ID=MMETSP0014_2-20120614/9171_1 /TAXON_ID=2857 /ORGANISM="Nitzschia sp." /LENGTH=269 /DNA_ID=CAMNT_0000348459 /DNA_START=458 /DNA_END=1264 /DNA_ORIENTATION=- /assembly_acc=CAM_ASM_000159